MDENKNQVMADAIRVMLDPEKSVKDFDAAVDKLQQFNGEN